MSIYENLAEDLQNRGGINRFTLVAAFDHCTNGGEGIYTANLYKVTDDLELIECTSVLKQHGLAKMNNKCTKWIMTTSQVDTLNYKLQDLKVLKQ